MTYQPINRQTKLDLLERRFGRLVAVECLGRGPHGTLWRCLCACGGTAVCQRSALVHGKQKSCGRKGCKARTTREAKAAERLAAVGTRHRPPMTRPPVKVEPLAIESLPVTEPVTALHVKAEPPPPKVPAAFARGFVPRDYEVCP